MTYSKHPRDPNHLAKSIIDIATGESLTVTQEEHMRALIVKRSMTFLTPSRGRVRRDIDLPQPERARKEELKDRFARFAKSEEAGRPSPRWEGK
ncbi:hypothetical protein [Bradyrhizobium sp. JYMT SZCCT0428]|uniref:hypothetical protein n=1 Tax=Bradyrhizobium sp. JYMT SZCCT0428 TaxID=2807673 RepID=UPI001BA705C6|nr:hypothetical protein [Bradyrhizobium sp. JYMT SZCCT0428]MBR1157380.1 hypothetical protein [Bradyrhizobium sp. JYMT SZCCT0428]